MRTSRFFSFGLLLSGGVLLSACSTVDSTAERVANAITPYKIEIVQGNFISREQVDALQVGMSRQQTREVLGTPLLTDIFHADRWDYIFTIKRQGVQTQSRRLTVYFEHDRVARFEGDQMPTEAQFVATIDAKAGDLGDPPPLEATPAQLQRYAPAKPAAGAAPTGSNASNTPAIQPVPEGNYPPLN